MVSEVSIDVRDGAATMGASEEGMMRGLLRVEFRGSDGFWADVV